MNLKNEKSFKFGDEFPTCHSNRSTTNDPDAMYMFLPAYTGTIKFDSKISFEGNCFENIEMEMN